MTRSRSTGFHSLLVASGILLSRIAGLVREQVYAHFLGTSPASGAFKAALRIPNLLQNLLGEGVLSASFIPVYARLQAEGKTELAGRVAGVVGALLALVVGVLSALGAVGTPWLVDLVAPGFHGHARALTIDIVRILFPGTGLLVLSAWCLGILNSHRKFFLSYVAPVVWNAAMIATLLIFGGRRSGGELAVLLAWGMVVGALLQLLLQLPFVFRHDREIRFALSTGLAPVRTVFKNLGPVAAGRGVVQLSAYVDSMLASFLGTAAVAGLSFAQTLYLLPISLFGMSIAAAELPNMSGVAGSAGTEEEIARTLRGKLEIGLGRVAFFVVPTVLAFLLLGDLLITALFQSGKFTAADSQFVAYVLAGSTVGLLAACLGRLYASTFYALGDPRTPFRIAIIRVSLTAALGVLFAFPLRPLFVVALLKVGLPIPAVEGGALALGAVGLTASAGIAAWIEFLLLRRKLGARIGRVALSGSLQFRLWGAALVAGAVAFSLRPIFAQLAPAGRLGSIVLAGLAAGTFGTIYLLMAFLFGVPQLSGLIRRLRKP
ncbi:MAG TPA: murein biosynthesis integral membrane protein MurJ [Thermoanaerobaculia bacterium]|nr:murein biosynthesis integral membrane protein MurJ [Thermoanaerobaculia bacterium]